MEMYYIKPVKDSKLVKQKINTYSSRSSDNAAIIVDEPVKYTIDELLEASDRVFALCDELGIGTVALREKENAILVGAKNLTEEKKNNVRKVAQIDIDNVLFEEYPDIDYVPMEEREKKHIVINKKKDIEEIKSKTTSIAQNWSDVVNSLNNSEYGGAYIDGDVLH